MRASNDFYVGWKSEMSKSNASFLKKRLWFLLLFIPLLSFILIRTQKGFNEHVFELGSITEITGIYYEHPVPMLHAIEHNLPNNIDPKILLVGFGKFGAEGTMKKLETNKQSLHGRTVTLAGTLIYGDGKTILELTEGAGSLIKEFTNPAASNIEAAPFKKVTLQGEIVDPKCYFGVMKPGEGKIHKSCAIRCLSGGIPAVLKVNISNSNTNEYYIVKDINGKKANKPLLPYIGQSITIEGMSSVYNGWNILHADPSNIQAL